MLLVRPSCRKKRRCPMPHSGPVLNSSGPACPCARPSAKPGPMWCTRRSEYRLMVIFPNAGRDVGGVLNEVVWQYTQPALVNCVFPFLVELVEGPGVGGVSHWIKYSERSASPGNISVRIPGVKLVTVSGTGLKTQPGVWSISLGKVSLVTPISTLYWFADISSVERTCAFHPKRMILPSFPL